MIDKSSSKPTFVFTDKINRFVPAGWKLWALVLRNLAETKGELWKHMESSEDFPYSYGCFYDDYLEGVRALYQETCESCKRTLPIGIYELEDPFTVLDAIKTIAKDIRNSFLRAERYFPNDDESKTYYAAVLSNCELILELLDPNHRKGEEEGNEDAFFGEEITREWYELLNGVCLQETSYEAFSEALNYDPCYRPVPEKADQRTDSEDNITDEIEELLPIDWDDMDYSFSLSSPVAKEEPEPCIKPLPGYGMTVYAFILLLMMCRRRKTAFTTFDGDMNTISVPDLVEDWATAFQKRLDWSEYHVQEDFWQEAYVSMKRLNKLPDKSVEEKYVKRLIEVHRERGVFESIVSRDNLLHIAKGEASREPSFDQYEYLHKCPSLTELEIALFQETEYLYLNRVFITSCFILQEEAEHLRDDISPLWKQDVEKDDAKIHSVYGNGNDRDTDLVLELLTSRGGFLYARLNEQPVIYAEMVNRYLCDCIIQNENLQAIIRRRVEYGAKETVKSTIERMKSRQSYESVCREEAKQELRKEGIIDEDCNIQLRNTTGKGKQYRTTELARFLVSARPFPEKEYVAPKNGWVHFLDKLKSSGSPDTHNPMANLRVKELKDGHFTQAFYDNRLKNDYGTAIINCLNWKLFDGVFKENGKALSGDELRRRFAYNYNERHKVLEKVIKKYDDPEMRTRTDHS